MNESLLGLGCMRAVWKWKKMGSSLPPLTQYKPYVTFKFTRCTFTRIRTRPRRKILLFRFLDQVYYIKRHMGIPGIKGSYWRQYSMLVFFKLYIWNLFIQKLGPPWLHATCRMTMCMTWDGMEMKVKAFLWPFCVYWLSTFKPPMGQSIGSPIYHSRVCQTNPKI